ncbi:hypothetical protein ACOSP7_032176 [Xanthoceras sorbifolium]
MYRPARGPRAPAGPVNSVGNTGQRTNSDGEQGDTAGARTNSAMQMGLEAATTMSLSQGGGGGGGGSRSMRWGLVRLRREPPRGERETATCMIQLWRAGQLLLAMYLLPLLA